MFTEKIAIRSNSIVNNHDLDNINPNDSIEICIDDNKSNKPKNANIMPEDEYNSEQNSTPLYKDV